MEKRKLHIGVLAVQGAFIEHERVLESLGAEAFEIRPLRDLDRPMDGLVLPGGESTVQGKLLRDLGLFEPLQKNSSAQQPKNNAVTKCANSNSSLSPKVSYQAVEGTRGVPP